MLSANIPFYKLENKDFREFLELYTKKEIPKKLLSVKAMLTTYLWKQQKKLKNVLTEKKFGSQLTKLLTQKDDLSPT